MTWEHASLSKSHFLDELLALLYTFTDELLALLYTFTDELLAFAYTFMDEHSSPKMHKHEENTKKRRRKHERYTHFCVFSSKQRTESSGENSPLIYEKSVG